MRKQIRRIPPAVFSALLTALAVTAAPSGPVRAADDCIAAPNKVPPQDSHWYYRIDRATQRKCWYLGAPGQKVHRVVPRLQTGQSSAVSEAERASTPIRTASAGEATAQDSIKEVAQDTAPSTQLVARWPDPLPFESERAGIAARTYAMAGGPMQKSQDRAAQEPVMQRPAVMIAQAAVASDRPQTPPSIAATAASADSTMTTLVRMLMLIASGILAGTMFKLATAWRRQAEVDRRNAERTAGSARERKEAAFAAQRAREVAQTQTGRTDLQRDAEAALRRFLRGPAYV